MKSSAWTAHLRRFALLALAVGLVVPVLALAAEPGPGADKCDPAHFCFPIQGYYIIDFIAFVGIIVYFGRKPIAAMLDRRHLEVTREIEAARATHEAASARYEEYRQRVGRLEEELARTMTEVRQGTEVEVKRILAEAEAQVQRITAEEQVRLDQESKRLRAELERDAARMALELAETLLRQRLDATGQKKLVDRALADLEALPVAGREARI